jgi:hypothetical protein
MTTPNKLSKAARKKFERCVKTLRRVLDDGLIAWLDPVMACKVSENIGRIEQLLEDDAKLEK